MKQNHQSQSILSLIVILLLLINFTHSNPKDFKTWKQQFRKSYAQGQDNYRHFIYLKTVEEVNAHNSDPTQTYKKGINQFAAYTQEEFELSQLVPIPLNQYEASSASGNFMLNASVVAVNWTALGKVTAVKSQGNCGGCYAFATIAGVQSAYLIQNNASLDLSVQQVLDCSSSYGNRGCSGGRPVYALRYIIANGITTNAAYPYAGVTQTCQGNGGAYGITGYTSSSGCASLQVDIANRPIIVGVDASTWSKYSSGVFNGCNTTPKLNHNVLLAGIDSSANWWIKNSWGQRWGEGGYIELLTGNSCGICNISGRLPYL